MKKFLIIIFFLSLTFKAAAPNYRALIVLESPPVKPFTKLIHAIGYVETKYDTLSYNKKEQAAGYFQIRPVRVNDYNRRTGSHYTVKDMFNYEISEKIFMYYASKISPYDFEKVAKSWNGSGHMTAEYWKKIKQYL